MRRRYIGATWFSWRDFRVFVEKLGTTSALFRSRYPRSYSWATDTSFLAEILFTLQGANWQRGGGRGDKPKRVNRPDDVTVEQLNTDVTIPERKQAMSDELARRRAARDRRRRTQGARKSRMIERVG